jgi:4-hydroxy-tetrahydrodipicolinate reductase
MTVSVCVAGATGWTGQAVAEAVLARPDFELTAAVSRSYAGHDLDAAWISAISATPAGSRGDGVPVFGSVDEALGAVDGIQVLVDYTSHTAVRANALAAIGRGVAVVIGSSRLSAADFAEIDSAATAAGVGVIAAGNFSITAALTQAAALLAARHVPSWEIIDYAEAGKPDAPSGTSRELAERLAGIRAPAVEIPIAQTGGLVAARGASVESTQIHSVRLPGFVLSTEVLFGLPDERLSIRHDAGTSAAPYVEGTLLAIAKVIGRVGLTRGLDTLLLEP